MNKIFLWGFCFVFIALSCSRKYGNEFDKLNRVYKNIDSVELSLNIYQPSGIKKDSTYPAIVFFFGGGWRAGDFDHFKRQSEYMAERGIIAVTPEYRTFTEHKTKPVAALQDAKDAVFWIRRHAHEYQIDTNRIVLSGGSAGGHLALSSYLTDLSGPSESLSFMPAAFVLFNPVIKTSHGGYGSEFIGKDSTLLSPVHNLKPGMPPAIIFHGTDDQVVKIQDIKEFVFASNLLRGDVEMIEFPGKRHGFFNPGVNNGIDFKETLYLADLFLLYHGFVNGAPQVYSDERDVPQLDYGLSSRGLMAGEVRDTSVVLRSEIVVAPNSKDFQDLFNMTKKAIFELDTSKRFISPLKSEMIETSSLKDNVAEISFTGLIPATRYYYRMRYGIRKTSVLSGTGTFKTLGNKENTSRKFIMYTGAHYSRFFKMHQTQNNHLKDDLHPFERLLGFPGHKKILELSPDFVIGNGDNVYYDHVHPTPALTKEEMRKVWHRMYDLPRFSELLKCVPFYFMKDDHDFRYNDSDTTSNPSALPTVDAGKYIFREQTSIPDREDYKTYRTVKIHPQCQIWMLEGRDYRSPNTMPDNRKKSMLGKEQKDWLKRTLKSSKAKYKLIISPVPFIGPDDAYKKDNFTNPGGFRSERQALFEWLLDHNFGPSNTLFLCGDRHWQYHSVHPSGFHEFSCGALVDENARLGRLPGDENSTDPQGLIVQPYTQKHPSGGFLEVVVINSTEEETALQFKFYDESGKMLYQYMYE